MPESCASRQRPQRSTYNVNDYNFTYEYAYVYAFEKYLFICCFFRHLLFFSWLCIVSEVHYTSETYITNITTSATSTETAVVAVAGRWQYQKQHRLEVRVALKVQYEWNQQSQWRELSDQHFVTQRAAAGPDTIQFGKIRKCRELLQSSNSQNINIPEEN